MAGGAPHRIEACLEVVGETPALAQTRAFDDGNLNQKIWSWTRASCLWMAARFSPGLAIAISS